MRLLITRAEGDAARLAAMLRARGHDCLIAPLIAIRFRADGAAALAPALAGIQAVLFTSANGVRAFAAATARREWRALAIGDATAAAARAAGFPRVESAGGAVADLARLAAASLKPAAGPLLHAAGGVSAGDLAGALHAAGFALRRTVLYDALPATSLSAAARDAFARNALDAALFFSPRTAASFVSLAAGLEDCCARVAAVALSAAVAERLKPLPWRRIAVAAAPNEAALIAALESICATERSL